MSDPNTNMMLEEEIRQRVKDINDKIDKAIKIGMMLEANTDSAIDLIYKDPHQWSTRPCSTCTAVTALLGKEFGCVIFKRHNG